MEAYYKNKQPFLPFPTRIILFVLDHLQNGLLPDLTVQRGSVLRLSYKRLKFILLFTIININ